MSSRILIAAGTAGAILLGGAPGRAPQPGDGAAGVPEGRLLAPVTGAVLTQPFGCTSFLLEPANPRCPSGHFHGGLDLAAPLGTQVRAATGGRARVLWNPSGYGLYVLLDSGGGLQTLYGHLSAASVLDGDAVRAGQEIGRMGSTGLSTGPHLHFEVRRNGRPVDPTPYLPAIPPTRSSTTWSTR
jgi:murein DD-endopeptidase MepM/ murein hydrolase activator NlpD